MLNKDVQTENRCSNRLGTTIINQKIIIMGNYINIRKSKSGLVDIGDCAICHAKAVVIGSNHKCSSLKKIDQYAPLEKDSSDLFLCIAYVRAAGKAKSRNIDFSLSFNRYKRLIKTKYCYYTNVLLDLSDENNDNYPTLERLDSSKGYTDNNTVIVCKRINQIKSNISIKDIEDIYHGLKRKSLL